jgi:hypothetical protein
LRNDVVRLAGLDVGPRERDPVMDDRCAWREAGSRERLFGVAVPTPSKFAAKMSESSLMPGLLNASARVAYELSTSIVW